MTKKPKLFLIDGHSYIYRAFHAIRDLSTSKGFPTNAVYGFTQMLLKIVRDKRPDFLAVVFDGKGPTVRHQAFAAYKANRPEMPDALVPQIPYIQKVVEGFRIPALVQEGYEADDLIGTLTRRGEAEGFDITIVTGDKDMLQLVSPDVRVYDTMKEKVYEEKDVGERFGVKPQQVIEVMGLMGDASDNIPGVPGIGEKTAIQLMSEFGTIENLLSHLDRVKRPKLRASLSANADQARMSRQLATIATDCPIDYRWESFRVSEPDSAALSAIFQELEFTSLMKAFSPRSRNEEVPASFQTFTDSGPLESFVKRVRSRGSVVLHLDGIDPSGSLESVKGLVFYSNGEGAYIPLKQIRNDGAFLRGLRPLLEEEKVQKDGYQLKPSFIYFMHRGIHLSPLGFDVKVAAYLINPGRSDYSIETLSLECLGKGMDADHPSQEGVDQTAFLKAFRTWELVQHLQPQLEALGLKDLFQDVEMPLIPVLARMEMKGFKLDTPFLESMGKELEGILQGLMDKIYRLAGEEFNINSPKQLQEILFRKLKLNPVKKTKTGFSTDEGVLIQLALQHDLPAEILNYRQLTKLKSTYVDALPQLVNPETGRLHTLLHQTVAATGRLSSSDPNLQNIPIRTEIGRRIREAFIVDEGKLLLSADYNQIELRILAHLSGDERLVEFFHRGEDIHLRTAMEIFGLPSSSVTAEMRRAAKTVNFGIIYGLSPYGLAVQLGVSQQEAKKYIDQYFEHYSGVKAFIERTIEQARTSGYVTTLFNRRRSVSDLQSQNNATRGFGERIAINSPIQGSAADLIKLAMIRIDRHLQQTSFDAHMILQIHDELLFEVPDDHMETVKQMVREEMEGVFPLKVPLKVDLGTGKNWAEAH